ncbi:hypothetical protein EV702DRAFT_1049611 [Suillus placidus]|uniref:Uncharacterized protein n=1 Tax=Suillus placidus TaxID=48579 RepID=A0A9P6ZL07_9AGAM|nr:hypothetical protein EV702DRAFT_1049611 [Suillus placidus]
MGHRKRNSSGDERPAVNELRAAMDKRPVEANAPTNDPAHSTRKMDTQLAKCRLGVAYIDIAKIQNPLLFGKYNDRPQVEREVNKLIASFKKEGILAMREDTAIPIMLSSTRLKSGFSLAVNFNEPGEVPLLQVDDAHTIVVASGQHRVAALEKYSKNVLDEIVSIEKRRHKISEMKNPTEEHIAEYNSLRNELGELQGALILMGKWGVIVYDEDAVLACGDALANHLCRNNSLHEYKETAEEVLSGILRLVRAEYNNASEEGRIAAAQRELHLRRDNIVERQKNARLAKVLSYEKLVLTLAIDLLPLGSHFRRRKEFQITWLAQSIDVIMGMFIQFILFHSHILRLLASNDEFPDYATVSDTIAAVYDDGPGHSKAVAQLEEWRQMIYDSTPVNPDVTIFNDVFDDVSIHVEEQFRNVPLKDIGTKASNYTSSLDNYSNYLVSKLRSKWHLSRTIPSQWNAIAHYHDRVTARIAVWLTPEDGAEEVPLPLLCGHVLDIAWSILTSTSAALAEVSGWFEPLLLHYRVLHRHSHLMDDKTEVMFTNLRKDPRIIDSEQIEEAVFTCLWALRTTMVLRLQNKLTTAAARSLQRNPFKDRNEVDEKFASLEPDEKANLKKLQNVIAFRKGRGRDLTTEPQVTPGVLALHVTSWDWNNCMSKNSKRDMDPFIKAILLDLDGDRTRREGLFNDPLVAGLRQTLEDVIAKHTQATNVIGESGRTIKRKRWLWYDGAEIPPGVTPIATVSESLMAIDHVMQARIQRRHELEGRDRTAIIKLISYIEHLAIAKATSSTQSPMAANVVRGLQTLMLELEINSSRLRARALEGDDSMSFNIKETVDLMVPVMKGVEDQNTIIEHVPTPGGPTASVATQARKLQPQKLTALDGNTSLPTPLELREPRSRPSVHHTTTTVHEEPPNPDVDSSAPLESFRAHFPSHTPDVTMTPRAETRTTPADTSLWELKVALVGGVKAMDLLTGRWRTCNTTDATPAVARRKGACQRSDVELAHTRPGTEDPTAAGDAEVDSNNCTRASTTCVIKTSVPSIHNNSRTPSVPKASRTETPRQSALESTTQSASSVSKRLRASTGRAKKKARVHGSSYTNSNGLEVDELVVVKPTM